MGNYSIWNKTIFILNDSCLYIKVQASIMCTMPSIGGNLLNHHQLNLDYQVLHADFPFDTFFSSSWFTVKKYIHIIWRSNDHSNHQFRNDRFSCIQSSCTMNHMKDFVTLAFKVNVLLLLLLVISSSSSVFFFISTIIDSLNILQIMRIVYAQCSCFFFLFLVTCIALNHIINTGIHI